MLDQDDDEKLALIARIGNELSEKGEDWLINYIDRNRYGSSGRELLASSPLLAELYAERSLAAQRYYLSAVLNSSLLGH